jgi:hypothetical protein
MKTIILTRRLANIVAIATLALVGAAQMAGAATFTWNGVNGTSIDTNWNDNANWLPNTGNPASADTAIFGATGTVNSSATINNVVTVNTLVAILNFTNTTSGQWHVTQIPSGITLTVGTSMTVGFGTAVDGLVTSAAMNDAGTLLVTGTPLTIGNSGTTSTPTDSILDLSGLSNFVYNNSTGTIVVGTGSRGGGNFNLAGASNSITAGTMNLNATSTSGSANGTMKLGLGTNIINAGTITMAAQRSSSTLSFFGSTGGLRLRGVGGTDASRATMNMGNRNVNTSGGTDTATLSFNGHPVDMKLGTLTLGQAINATPTGTQGATGIINFDTGTIDATTINMAISSANAFNIGIGTINVGANGTLVVGSGGLSLANQGALGASTGNLNISGGAVNSSGNIIKTTSAGTGNITFSSGGTLIMASGKTVGTTAVPINTLTLVDGSSLHLNVNASSTMTNIVSTTVAASGTTTITIDSIANYIGGTTTNALISYTGTDPFTSLTLAPLPAGFTGSLSDNSGNGRIDLVITAGPSVVPPIAITWNGGSLTDNNWSDLNNWNGTNLVANDTLFFDGSAQLNNNNDTTAGTLYSNITFNATAGAFVLSGIPSRFPET